MVEEIIRRYTSGERQTAIARAMGLDSRRITYAIDRLGIKKHEHRLYALTNERAFAEVTEGSAYWVGFIMGDGSIARDRYGVASSTVISLAACDEAHILKFLRFAGSSQSPTVQLMHGGFSPHASAVTASIYSRPMVQDLLRFGVTHGKTKRASVELLADDRHFWRGLFDADGSLGIYSHGRHGDGAHISISEPEPLISQFATYVRRNFPDHTVSVVRHPRTDVVRTIQLSNRIARSVVKLLYDGATVYLDRKMETARRVLDWRPRRRLDLLGSLFVGPAATASIGPRGASRTSA
jgi:hypothetical protein